MINNKLKKAFVASILGVAISTASMPAHAFIIMDWARAMLEEAKRLQDQVQHSETMTLITNHIKQDVELAKQEIGNFNNNMANVTARISQIQVDTHNNKVLMESVIPATSCAVAAVGDNLDKQECVENDYRNEKREESINRILPDKNYVFGEGSGGVAGSGRTSLFTNENINDGGESGEGGVPYAAIDEINNNPYSNLKKHPVVKKDLELMKKLKNNINDYPDESGEIPNTEYPDMDDLNNLINVGISNFIGEGSMTLNEEELVAVEDLTQILYPEHITKMPNIDSKSVESDYQRLVELASTVYFLMNKEGINKIISERVSEDPDNDPSKFSTYQEMIDTYFTVQKVGGEYKGHMIEIAEVGTTQEAIKDNGIMYKMKLYSSYREYRQRQIQEARLAMRLLKKIKPVQYRTTANIGSQG